MCPHTNTRARAGFTLTEVMVTSTIVGLILAGAGAFFLQTGRYLFTTEQKLLINADIRDFTNEMVENAREANYFVLYRSFASRSRNGVTVQRDSNGNGTVNAADRRAAGQGGEFLVFVYYEDPFFDSRFYDGDATNNAIVSSRVTRLVAYWVAPNREDASEWALYRMDTDSFRSDPTATTWTTSWNRTFPVTLNSVTTLESLLPPASSDEAQASYAEIVVNDVEGLAPGGDYFVNFQNRSILVRAKILHGNQAKRVTNTYNFTVTPRG